jgi:predicted transcriptional regulator
MNTTKIRHTVPYFHGEFITQGQELGRPGKVSRNPGMAVMISPAEHDRIRDQVRFLESVTAGLADADAGRTMNTPQLKKHLKSRQHKCKSACRIRPWRGYLTIKYGFSLLSSCGSTFDAFRL